MNITIKTTTDTSIGTADFDVSSFFEDDIEDFFEDSVESFLVVPDSNWVYNSFIQIILKTLLRK